jgi:hypothetical protein
MQFLNLRHLHFWERDWQFFGVDVVRHNDTDSTDSMFASATMSPPLHQVLLATP